MDSKTRNLAAATAIPVGIAIYNAYAAAAPDARNIGLLVGFAAYLVVVAVGWARDRVRRRVRRRRTRVRRRTFSKRPG